MPNRWYLFVVFCPFIVTHLKVKLFHLKTDLSPFHSISYHAQSNTVSAPPPRLSFSRIYFTPKYQFYIMPPSLPQFLFSPSWCVFNPLFSPLTMLPARLHPRNHFHQILFSLISWPTSFLAIDPNFPPLDLIKKVAVFSFHLLLHFPFSLIPSCAVFVFFLLSFFLSFFPFLFSCGHATL